MAAAQAAPHQEANDGGGGGDGGGSADAASTILDEKARGQETLKQAERDDDALLLERAASEYEEALRLDPSTSKAMRATERAKAIRARSEGDFAPLAALERVRRDAALSSNAKAIDDLVVLSRGFPPGLVRLETWTFAADAYANRLDRPADAVPLWQAIIADPKADAVMFNAAIRSLTSYHLTRGEYANAAAVIQGAGTRVDDKLARDVRRALRRHDMHNAAVVVLASLLLLATFSIGKAARRGELKKVIERARASSRLSIAYAAYVAISGALLASGYEEGTSRPFLIFGIVLVPLLLISRAWAAAGSPMRWARALRAMLCATSTLGAAFLVLEHVDVAYLEGMGL